MDIVIMPADLQIMGTYVVEVFNVISDIVL